ncbi:hypothetical protein [Leucobacter insecticola]|uniref:hypothetical protein n=1 Tax=Leucobacter insecticola TaxID=2714934 RepID=UPI001FCB4242|nr:hypothetical protein [Leucobacter insecticola]
MAAAPVRITALLGILGWTLWKQALVLLRGKKSPRGVSLFQYRSARTCFGVSGA